MSGILMENISIERTGINKMFKIWQIKNIEKTPYTFCGWGKITKDNFNFNDYKCVFETEKNDTEDLEDIYSIFNGNLRPNWAKDFMGRSMSVSDIVELNGNFYYCDFIGWVRLDIEEDGTVK